ncbi:MAG: hypothetical protein IPO02_16190 [Bacteroidetes bacterium]|nr:hypothetical protein [Bacteroidota bacterium]
MESRYNPILDFNGTPNADFTRGQAWWNLSGAVDPNNPNTLFVGGVESFKSIDGGITWAQITAGSGTNA